MKLLVKIIPFFLLFCLSTSVYSQDSTEYISDHSNKSNLPDKKFDWDKVFIGGNIGLLFGDYTIIDIYPIIGYRITTELSAGFGVTYQYFSDNRSNFSTSIYGGSVFARYAITENLFAHTEYELLNREFIIIDGSTKMIIKQFRQNVGSLLVGGGYRQQIGGSSYFTLLVLWNLNDSVYSLYPNPIIRMGVSVGL